MEPVLTSQLPPVAPSLPEPSHLISAAALLSACTASQLDCELSASSLFQSLAQPHRSNRWHCCHLQEDVWVLSEGLTLLYGLAWPGWEDRRKQVGGREICFFTRWRSGGLGRGIPLCSLPHPSVPPPIPLPVTAGALSWLREARAKGTSGSGRLGGGR